MRSRVYVQMMLFFTKCHVCRCVRASRACKPCAHATTRYYTKHVLLLLQLLLLRAHHVWRAYFVSMCACTCCCCRCGVLLCFRCCLGRQHLRYFRKAAPASGIQARPLEFECVTLFGGDGRGLGGRFVCTDAVVREL